MKNEKSYKPIDPTEFFRIHKERITDKMKKDIETIFKNEDKEKLKQKRIEKLKKLNYGHYY